MYFAMNRFMIAPGFEEAFETMWRERESYLDQVLVFKPFICLKGNHKRTIRPTFRTPVGISRSVRCMDRFGGLPQGP